MSDHCWHQVTRKDCRMAGFRKNTVPMCCKCGKEVQDCGQICFVMDKSKDLQEYEKYMKPVSSLGAKDIDDGR